MLFASDRNLIIGSLLLLLGLVIWLGMLLRPVGVAAGLSQTFEVKEGEGVSEIAKRLEVEKFIRSPFAFRLAALLRGSYSQLKPGIYTFDRSSSTLHILDRLVKGAREEIEVRIADGATVYEIDALLAGKQIIQPGALVEYIDAEGGEGELLPDTYLFFVSSTPESVAKKMLDNFSEKTRPLFGFQTGKKKETIIIASLLEREVDHPEQSRVVSGILIKRLKEGMPLQVDASICEPKLEALWKKGEVAKGCGPITEKDLAMKSPYNTYLNKGLPPGPVGNPGLEAIKAALEPKSSAYWFYLNDPETGETVFATTFEEHRQNINRHLL